MSKKTVYVIGAGASYELGLPVGSELKGKISQLLDMAYDGRSLRKGDSLIEESICRHQVGPDSFGTLQYYIDSAHEIRDALPLAISIDNFLDSRRGNRTIELCGKLGIVRSILQAERKSLLFNKNPFSINFNKLKESWHIDFFKVLTENCSRDDLTERFSNISLIVFNYDRCIQHFLYHALQTYSTVSESEAAKLVLSINIIHPYGSVGSLPWKHYDEGQQMGFGAEPNDAQLLELAKRIKTFTEGHDQASKGQIEEVINNCERLVFLGFAFHNLNMNLIFPTCRKDQLKLKECYATTLSRSEEDENKIVSILNEFYHAGHNPYPKEFVHIKNTTCKNFFSEFSIGLSFSR